MNNLIKYFLFVTIILATVILAQAKSPYVLILGTAQDAGAPQMGCMSEFCKKAWKDKKLRKMVSSIALVNPKTKQRWIFDATPDLPSQFQLLRESTKDFSNKLDGIFLTHAHIGHYTGLMYLGRESMGTKGVKVYAMPRMKKMLSENAPWSQLVSLNNISLQNLENKKEIELTKNLKVEPFLVPHRDEFSETVGYKISSANKSLIFIPDIDKWQKWNTKLLDLVRENDYLFLDATFFADGEIPRPMSEVPHPFVSETMDLLKNLSLKEKNKVHFIHFNHSNPLIQGNKEKIKEVREKGFNIAYEKQKVYL